MINAALVLEGGALKGVYTSGVLDVLMEHGIEFSCVIGVSAGALAGANYIAKNIGHSARSNLMHANDPNYYGLRQLFLKRSVFNFEYLFNLNDPIDGLYPFNEDELKNTKQRFIICATNVETGKPVYFEGHKDYKSLTQALKASSSIPLLCRPTVVNGITCLDGCISDPICIKKAIAEGYDKAVLVLTRSAEYIHRQPSKRTRFFYQKIYKKYPHLIEALDNNSKMQNALLDDIKEMEKENKVFVIRPRKKITIKSLEKDVHALLDLYLRGREDALHALPQMKEYLTNS